MGSILPLSKPSTSGLEYRVSRIEHQASNIKHRSFCPPLTILKIPFPNLFKITSPKIQKYIIF